MNNQKSEREKVVIHEILQFSSTINMHIQPFKEMPSLNNPGQEGNDRMNAYDLFSQYTADIIKEDIVYAR